MNWKLSLVHERHVRVPAGSYSLAAPLLLDRDVLIEGEGPGRTLLLSDVQADPLLCISSGRIRLRNLSIRRGSGSGDLIEVRNGSLLAQDVEIEGATLDPGAAAGGAGLRASRSGRLCLQECTIRSCEYAGVVAQDDGVVEATSCRIEACGSGLLAWGRARVRLEQCRIRAMAEFGAGVQGDVRAEIRDCTVLGGRMGLVFSASSRGQVERCRVEESGQVGIFVRERSDADVTGCLLAGNRGLGLCYGAGAKGRASGNSMIGNARGAIFLEPGAKAKLGSNRIEESEVVRIGGG